MRIGLVAPLWETIPPGSYGGIELVMDLLCEGMLAKGHEVTLFASGDCQTQARLHAVIPKNLNHLMERGLAYVSEYYSSAVLAEALLRHRDFDIFHAHVPLAWLPFAGLSSTPCLFTLHTSVHVDDLWTLERFPMFPVAGVSRAQCRIVEQKLNRVLPVVHNAIDFGVYHARYEPGRYLTYLGRMSPEKNPLGAIHIAEASGFPLILAGAPQGPKEVRYFEEKIRPRIDGKQVRWLGPVGHEEKIDLLSHAAALLFPIEWEEPFGLVIIEAMACGTPVLAINRGAVQEIVESGTTGFVGVSENDLLRALPAALTLDRREVRRAAESRFSHHQMVENYLGLYQRIISPVRDRVI